MKVQAYRFGKNQFTPELAKAWLKSNEIDYTLFEASLINNTTAHVLAVGNLGVAYSLIKSGTNWYVDIADAVTKLVEVVGFIDPVGDTNPRVIVRFIGDHQANVLQA